MWYLSSAEVVIDLDSLIGQTCCEGKSPCVYNEHITLRLNKKSNENVNDI